MRPSPRSCPRTRTCSLPLCRAISVAVGRASRPVGFNRAASYHLGGAPPLRDRRLPRLLCHSNYSALIISAHFCDPCIASGPCMHQTRQTDAQETAHTGRAFGALRHRDFRLFWFGSFFSQAGNWMQQVAQSWLIYDLTRSPLLVGVGGL